MIMVYGERVEWIMLPGGERGWSVSAVFQPCDALGWVGTTNWFLTPTEYASLSV